MIEEKVSFAWTVELEVFNGKQLCRRRTEKVKASHGAVKQSVLDVQFWIQRVQDEKPQAEQRSHLEDSKVQLNT